jgi:glyoxalase family protein
VTRTARSSNLAGPGRFCNLNGRERNIAAAALRPTTVLDRQMFKSIYFHGPSGVLFELARGEPGFVFEPPERLGESLVLIGDLESRREELERRFPVLSNPRAS